MAHHGNIAPDQLADGPNLALARILSIVFSPPLVAIASYVLVVALQPSPLVGLGWALFSLMIQMVPGVILYTYRRRTGEYRDADVSVRQERNELYLLGAVSVLVSLGLLYLLHAPYLFRVLALSSLSLGVVCGLINLYWKISMHAAAIGSFATIVAFFSPTAGAVIWACALAVGWARIKTRNHTPLQVVAGLIVSALATIGAFLFAGI